MPCLELLGESKFFVDIIILLHISKMLLNYSGFDQLDKIGWINVVYGMTTASFIPLYGAFSNVFGVSNTITLYL